MFDKRTVLWYDKRVLEQFNIGDGGKWDNFMISFPKPDRVRYVLSETDRLIYQELLHQCAADGQWIIKSHVYDNISQKRASTAEIEKLKSLVDWYVWAFDVDLKTKLADPKLKLVVRYPCIDDDKWVFAGVVAIGKPLMLVSLFLNEPRSII